MKKILVRNIESKNNMKKDYTHCVIILDESGSMSDLKNNTINSYNEFIQEQKKNKGDCTLTLYTFNNKSKKVYDEINLQELNNIDSKLYNPNGMTALYDCIGKAIDEVGKSLASKKEKDRPEKVIFLIMTDGEENSSRKFSAEKISTMIEHQRNKYSWQFVFMGSNQDAVLNAKKINIDKNFAITYNNSEVGVTNAVYATNNLVSAYRSNLAVYCDGFTKQDRANAQSKG